MRALLDAIPDLMFRITADGTYVDFVGDAELLANPSESVVGGRWTSCSRRTWLGPLMATIHEALESGKLQTLGYVLPTIRGDERQFEARVVPIDDNQVVTIVRDATELRRTERELRAAHDRLVRARDAERRRLERNLHDGAQQRLIVALQALRIATSRLPAGKRRRRGAPAARGGAARVRDRGDPRAGAWPPPVGADRGRPRGGAQQLVTRVEELLPVELDVPAFRLEPELEVCTYYLVAEALANAAKYAGATTTAVRVAVGVDAITVEITDDGCGGACATPAVGSRGSPSASPRSEAPWRSKARRARERRCARSSPCRGITPERLPSQRAPIDPQPPLNRV